jgi:hypothetical protein
MSDLDKTMPAALEAHLRPRRMRRIHGTVARTRAEGAWFDAVLWTVFALVVVGVLLTVVRIVDTRGIDENYLIAGGLLVALGVAALLWWRWFKWQVHASSLMPAQRFESSRAEGA